MINKFKINKVMWVIMKNSKKKLIRKYSKKSNFLEYNIIRRRIKYELIQRAPDELEDEDEVDY